MRASISEATATFLEAAGDDLQSQLGTSGTVVGMDADSAPDGSTTLVAAVRIGASTVEMIGTGDGPLPRMATCIDTWPNPSSQRPSETIS